MRNLFLVQVFFVVLGLFFASNSFGQSPNNILNSVKNDKSKNEKMDTIVANWQKLKEISLDFVPKQVSKSRTGNLYMTDAKGNVYFYDIETNERKAIYSPEKIAQISQINAWQTQEITLFYADYQEFHTLDRFLKPINKHTFPKSQMEFITASTPASDGSIWAWDSGTNSLKKYDITEQKVYAQTNLSTILPDLEEINVNFLREYQYQIFMAFLEEKTELDKFFVFDVFGNFKKIIDLKKIFNFLPKNTQYCGYIDFWGVDFYTVFEKNIYFVNVYSENLKTQNMPNENTLLKNDQKNALFWLKIEDISLKKDNLIPPEIIKKEKWVCVTANKLIVFECVLQDNK